MSQLLRLFGGGAGSNILQMGLAVPGTIMDSLNQAGANAINWARFQQGKGLLESVQSTQGPQLDELSKSLQESYGKAAAEGKAGYDTLKTGLETGYAKRTSAGTDFAQQRYDMAMKMLAKSGQQETADIGTQYANLNSQAQGDVANRGLGGTLVGASLRSGNARQKAAALNRLNERLTQQKLDTHNQLSADQLNTLTTLSGQELGAKQSLGQGQLEWNRQMGLDEAMAKERLTQLPIQYQQANIDRMLALLTGSPVTASPNNPYSTLAGVAGSWDKAPSTPSADIAGPAISGGSSIVAGTLSAKILIKTCVDARAMITTPMGYIRLSDVQEGDEVLGTDRVYHRVLAVDCGMPPAPRVFIRLRTRLTDLILSDDHPIDGRTAGDLLAGECVGTLAGPEKIMKVQRLDDPFVLSGDLLLEGEGGYWANGIAVESTDAIKARMR